MEMQDHSIIISNPIVDDFERGHLFFTCHFTSYCEGDVFDSCYYIATFVRDGVRIAVHLHEHIMEDSEQRNIHRAKSMLKNYWNARYGC